MTTNTQEPTFRESVSSLISSLSSTANKLITLVLLEGRLAGLSLILIIGLAFVGSFLLFTAWLFLMFVAAFAIAKSSDFITASLIIAGFNLFLLFPVIALIVRFYRNLRFPATRRQLEISKMETKGLVQ